MARLDKKPLGPVVLEAIGEVEAARSTYIRAVTLDERAKVVFLSAGISALDGLRGDLGRFTDTPPAED